MAGYNVTSLQDYIKTNEDVLVKRVVLGSHKGDTIENMRKQLGVKTKERLNYLDVDPVLQDGKTCGFTAKGNTVFADKDIEVKTIKVNDQFCDKDLLGKFAENLVNIAAGKETLPFEAEIVDGIIEGINDKMEKGVWQGITEVSMKGLIELATASSSTVKVSLTKAEGIYKNILDVYMALPEEIIDDAVIFVSPANFRSFLQELVAKNLYHYPSAVEDAPKDFIIPGTNTKVHSTYGLTGVNNKIYASVYGNMVFGTDLMGDEETVKGWYDETNEVFKYKVRWNAGVATLFDDAVVLGTIA